MANEVTHARGDCPHCGKPAGLRWWSLLPSNNRKRSFKCQSCQRSYDASDVSKMASIFGGLAGMGPGIFLFGRILQAGGGHSAASVIVATAVVTACFALGAIILGWLTLRLVPKP
jgi:hypothetical protein